MRRRSTPMASASMTRPYFLVLALAPADSVFSPDDDDGVAAVEGFGGVFAEFEFGFDEVTGGVLVLGPGPGPVFAGVLEDPAFGDCCGAGLDDGGFRGVGGGNGGGGGGARRPASNAPAFEPGGLDDDIPF